MRRKIVNGSPVCKRGHEVIGDNILSLGGHVTACRICHRESVRKWMHRWREANSEKSREINAIARAKYPDRYRESVRKSRLRRLYGITDTELEILFNSQDGKCAICLNELKNAGGRWNAPAIDHDHETGKVRGLLCHHCNVALGSFRDSIRVLKSAISYLEKFI